MGAAIIMTLLGLNSVVFTVFALRIVSNIQRHLPTPPKTMLGYDTDIPSVTVCIPARNEEHALAECLQRVINSTYEKIEIIVLDDSSSDGTSLLIKSFAHAGVRFVRGSALPDGWIGKNHALNQLVRQASGSYVLFLDVDTRLSPVAIEYMVREMMSKGAEMISTIPRRNDSPRASVIWSPLKYYWELLRSRNESPAAASNAWLVRRASARTIFEDNEGAIKNAVLPEAYIASRLKSKYTYAVGTKDFGVAYEKKWLSQCETSVRLLHPMLGGKMGTSLVVALGLLSLMTPYVTLATLPWAPFTYVHTAALIVAVAFGLLYMHYARTVWNRASFIAFFIWPLILIQEVALIVTSAVLYKSGRILWKGRPLRSVQPHGQ